MKKSADIGHLASETIFGLSPDQLLCPVPYRDLILATTAALENLKTDLHTDTRNVLLHYTRIWCKSVITEGNCRINYQANLSLHNIN